MHQRLNEMSLPDYFARRCSSAEERSRVFAKWHALCLVLPAGAMPSFQISRGTASTAANNHVQIRTYGIRMDVVLSDRKLSVVCEPEDESQLHLFERACELMLVEYNNDCALRARVPVMRKHLDVERDMIARAERLAKEQSPTADADADAALQQLLDEDARERENQMRRAAAAAARVGK